MDNQLSKTQEKEFENYVNQVTPKKNLWLQVLKAFFLGGFICLIGQVVVWIGINYFGLEKDVAGTWCSVLLVLTSVILTGFNLYGPIVKFGGAGATVPISGFGYCLANGVKEAINEMGFLGIFIGGVKACAAGITAAVVFGFLASLFAKPSLK